MVRRLSMMLVALLAVSYVPAAAPATQSGSAAQGRKLTITILSRTQVAVPHDTKPKGRENKGDWIQYSALLVTVGPLWGKQKNKPVGWEAGTQTFTSATGQLLKGKATFPGQGTIQFKGLMKTLKNGKISVSITGGTGKFAGAKGVLLIGPGDVESVNTYRLTIPEVGLA